MEDQPAVDDGGAAAGEDDGWSAEPEGEVAEVVTGEAIRRWTRGDTARTVASLVVLAGTAVVARAGTGDAEAAVFRWVNGASDAWFVLVWPIMQLGAVLVAVAVGAGVGIGLRSRKVAVVLGLAPVVAWLVARIVKHLVGRGRPAAEVDEVVVRGGAELGLGFVSGHTTVAFALAAAVAAHLRRPWAWGLFGLATVVGLGRIYVGAHLPLDVVGGAACGLLVGEAVRALEVRQARRSAVRRAAEDGGRPT